MRRRKIKILSQAVCLGIFVFAVCGGECRWWNEIFANIVIGLDSLSFLHILIAGAGWSRYAAAGLILIVLVLIFGNFFCFWICPLGSMVDIGKKVCLRSRWNFQWKLPKWTGKIRYFILAIIIAAAIAGRFFKMPYSIEWLSDPFVIMTRAVWIRGWWLVYLLFLVAISIILPRFWCFRICPLGALYYLLGTRIRRFFRLTTKKLRKVKNTRFP